MSSIILRLRGPARMTQANRFGSSVCQQVTSRYHSLSSLRLSLSSSRLKEPKACGWKRKQCRARC
eukprot:m.63666 g.63666  ORF g.63666 m.63666 type:complete len:65 (+) comp35180_c1_seq2:307-501(+)